jgi:hypothetical protein
MATIFILSSSDKNCIQEKLLIIHQNYFERNLKMESFAQLCNSSKPILNSLYAFILLVLLTGSTTESVFIR